MSSTAMRGNSSDSSSPEQSVDRESESDEVLSEEEDDVSKETQNAPFPSDSYGQEQQNVQQGVPNMLPSNEQTLGQVPLELVGHSIACAPNPYCDPYYSGMMAAYGQPLVRYGITNIYNLMSGHPGYLVSQLDAWLYKDALELIILSNSSVVLSNKGMSVEGISIIIGEKEKAFRGLAGTTKHKYPTSRPQPVHPQFLDMHQARMPLPLEMTQEPVYVNAKQYHAILRRRQSRAKAELEKKLIKDRKPYLHESRHQHAMRRVRGSGGRFAKKTEVDSLKRADEDKNTTASGSAISSQSVNSTGIKRMRLESAESLDFHKETRGDRLVNSLRYNNEDNYQASGYHLDRGDGGSLGQQWISISSNQASQRAVAMK
ncbi:CCAAT-binding factor, conserved site-containing protein [Cynara cardunculus var. scolymus]|uniref:Nuclear transcription factor Y subunit n=1 Tax=Cynara cardunculus var. scolymus TaxID=59895 RepID=A0A118K5N8_CYNCS|nr:CCAAT-binding factor, conserved site-containing protein [Cynara cardunculus var. scolymus]